MSTFDAFGYEGKRVLVVGGASGMGAATVTLARDAGAEVLAMDYAPIDAEGVTAIQVNLAERDSIDEALESVDGTIDVVFACAGVADGTSGIERINFIGHRYLIDKLLDSGTLGAGGAIGMISSAAGLGWESKFETLNELLDISDWDDAVAWVEKHEMADYMHMKMAMCAYVARECHPMLKRGVRLNAICPGPTDTPLAQANAEMWLTFGADYREDVGVAAATALEQAYPLVFLCSDAASAINGQTLVSDAGYLSAGITNSFPDANPVAQFILGRL